MAGRGRAWDSRADHDVIFDFRFDFGPPSTTSVTMAQKVVLCGAGFLGMPFNESIRAAFSFRPYSI
jgi:hypothetical protein